MSRFHLSVMCTLICAHAVATAQTSSRRDEFFWLGEINKASAVINTDEGLLAEARRIYRDAVKGYAAGELPMSEAEFRSALDPVAIVNNRATAGGPQPAEMKRMLAATKQKLAQQDDWLKERRGRISEALAKLDNDFVKLLQVAR